MKGLATLSHCSLRQVCSKASYSAGVKSISNLVSWLLKHALSWFLHEIICLNFFIVNLDKNLKPKLTLQKNKVLN